MSEVAVAPLPEVQAHGEPQKALPGKASSSPTTSEKGFSPSPLTDHDQRPSSSSNPNGPPSSPMTPGALQGSASASLSPRLDQTMDSSTGGSMVDVAAPQAPPTARSRSDGSQDDEASSASSTKLPQPILTPIKAPGKPDWVERERPKTSAGIVRNTSPFDLTSPIQPKSGWGSESPQQSKTEQPPARTKQATASNDSGIARSLHQTYIEQGLKDGQRVASAQGSRRSRHKKSGGATARPYSSSSMRSSSTAGSTKSMNFVRTPTGQIVRVPANAGRRRRLPKRVTGPIAGYSSPTDPMRLPEATRNEAAAIVKDAKLCKKTLKDPIIKMCVKAAGLVSAQLKPRSVKSFWEKPVDTPEVCQARHDFYEQRRLENWALVLHEKPDVEENYEKLVSRKANLKSQLANSVVSAIDNEKERLERLEMKAKSQQEVFDREDDLLRKQRREFEKRQRLRRQKEERHEQQVQERNQELKRRGKMKQSDISRAQANRDAQIEKQKRAIAQKNQEREQKYLEYAQSVLQQQEEAREKRRAEHLARVERAREDARRKALEEREMKYREFAEKRERMEAAERRRLNQQDEDKLQRQFDWSQKMDNAERVRRQKQWRKMEVMEKLEVSKERLNALKDMQEAFANERQERRKQMTISRDTWRNSHMFERDITPGPMEYTIKSEIGAQPRGKIGNEKPKSQVDWIIYQAKQTPGPGQYGYPSLGKFDEKPGGKMSSFKPKSQIEWLQYEAEKTPGVGDYDPKPVFTSRVPQISPYKSKSPFDLALLQARETPGPLDYQKPNLGPEGGKRLNLDRLREMFATEKARKTRPSLGGKSPEEEEEGDAEAGSSTH